MKGLVVACAALLAASGIARADGDAARGEQRFAECAPCHALTRDVESIGPSLYGLFGRKAGTSPDFRYSPAFKRSGVTWNAQSLDKYLADPQAFIPGNRMPFAGITDATARTDLIAYLAKTFK
ncbi:MAG TPA: c-type cytochrome [Xanthobacteraceae bacterium]|nr:c-type cytochrome [Xanthobacteraceae bacterium]